MHIVEIAIGAAGSYVVGVLSAAVVTRIDIERRLSKLEEKVDMILKFFKIDDP